MEKMREEFEAWYSAKYQIAGAWCDTAYAKELAFDAWKQSRAAVRVELPLSATTWPDGTLLLDREKVEQALDAVGIRYV